MTPEEEIESLKQQLRRSKRELLVAREILKIIAKSTVECIELVDPLRHAVPPVNARLATDLLWLDWFS